MGGWGLICYAGGGGVYFLCEEEKIRCCEDQSRGQSQNRR